MSRRVVTLIAAAFLAAVLVVPATGTPAAPQAGGTLIVGRAVNSVTLSPHATTSPDAEVIAYIVETLYGAGSVYMISLPATTTFLTSGRGLGFSASVHHLQRQPLPYALLREYT